MDTAAQTIETLPRGWYCLRLDGVRRPGCFLDESTAELAKQFNDAELTELQEKSNARIDSTLGVIWQKDLEGTSS